MGIINKMFFKGLIVILPLTISIYVLILVATKAEGAFAPLIKSIIGSSLYVPGLGILVTFVAIMGVGVLVSNYITAKVIHWTINKVENAPFIKSIYRPLKDLMSLFGGNSQSKMKKVVLIKNGLGGHKMLGLVTREEFNDMPNGAIEDGTVAVYIPMGYMVGGCTLLVPKSSVTELDIPVETAFKLAITGWIKAENISAIK